MTQPDQPTEAPEPAVPPPPVPVEAFTAAALHLNRAATIMDVIATAADDNDGYFDLDRAEGMFRQAEIHALIGSGYANLTHPNRRPDTVFPTTPPVAYPNG